MLLVIFFIRVRIFFRDLNFSKFFKVFFLVCIFKIKIIFRIVILLFQNVNVIISSELVNKFGMSVIGIFGFSRFQINKYFIQKDVNFFLDRFYFYFFFVQQMSYMKFFQFFISIQILIILVFLQSSGVRILVFNIVILSKVLSVGFIVLFIIIVLFIFVDFIFIIFLILIRIYFSVFSSVGKVGIFLF